MIQRANGAALRLVVLISGGGRTLLNLREQIRGGGLNARIERVISSRADASGVVRARQAGLAVEVVDRRAWPADEFQRRLSEAVAGAGPDLVCMAGFLSLWRVPSALAGRVINIHPALLPRFGGPGMYGRRVHEAVLASGATESGCSVHFCDDLYDHGPVILQRRVPVLEGDTPDTLAARVFEQECIAYPQVVRWFAEGRVRLDGDRVVILT